MTLQELVDNFLEYRNKDVETKRIVKGRWVTIRSQCRHVLAYKSPNLKIAELDRDSFYDYETYRKTVSGAKDVTIRNEQATINEMVRYAYRQGYTHIDKFNFRPIKISKSKISSAKGYLGSNEINDTAKIKIPFMKKIASNNFELNDPKFELIINNCQ